MEQVIKGIPYLIILILVFFIISMATTWQPYNLYVTNIIILLGIVLITYTVYTYSLCDNSAKKEDYVNCNTSNVSVLPDEDEDIKNITNYLTLYYSVFNKKSIGISQWNNISKYTLSNGCSSSDANFKYSTQEPSIRRETGLYLGLNSLTGPESYKLGIVANDSFTIFFTIKFNDLSNISDKMNVFSMYANTTTNNGLSMYLQFNKKITEDLMMIDGIIEYGDQELQMKALNINVNYIYLCVIRKEGNNINLNLFPNIGDLNSNSNNVFNLLSTNIGIQDVLLSNKNIMINNTKNLQAHIYNFGIFSKYLDILSGLYLHIQSELQKNNTVVKNFNSIINSLQQQIQQSQDCPYNCSVQASCPEITNWCNFSDVITKASPVCLQSINNFCEANPTNAMCTCWNNNNNLCKTNQCINFVNIFKDKKCLMTDTIDDPTLSIIKTKYNLCACPAQVPVQTVQTVPVQTVQQVLTAPAPKKLQIKQIDKAWTIDSNYLNIFNSCNEF